MKEFNKECLINESISVVEKMCGFINDTKEIKINELKGNTALFIIDMNNGFAKQGNLYSERIKSLIEPIKNFTKTCLSYNIPIFLYTDCHSAISPELKSYPKHCMVDSSECEVVEEIKSLGDLSIIRKNSTNSFVANTNELIKFISLNNIKNFIIAGDCTDICIYQFAVTLKAYMNECNKNSRVIVPLNLIDTYNASFHNADFANIVSIYSMQSNGIEVVKDIK